MWETIGAIFQTIGAALGLVAQKDAQKNAADVKAAQEAQDAEDEKGRIEGDVAKGDLNAIQKDVAE